jgi:hypothetical protein
MFKLMVPSSYGAPYRLEGPVGATPDVQLVNRFGSCRRATLPPFLDRLIFNFIAYPGLSLQVWNFYHLGDFFVVSNTLRKFLEARAGCTFEVAPIQTKHPDNKKTEQYWAMKVTTRVDCILPKQSFAKDPFVFTATAKPFEDSVMEVKLTPDVSPFFANKGENTYYSYPGFGVQNVSMDFDSVPRGAKLFQPAYWPHLLVVEVDFANELDMRCAGGTVGYYFWTLGFDDVSDEYHKTSTQLR